jgi:hypothetical protein
MENLKNFGKQKNQVFKLGKIKFDEDLYKLLICGSFTIQMLLKRHAACDWGDLSFYGMISSFSNIHNMISIFPVERYLVLIETQWDCSETSIYIINR